MEYYKKTLCVTYEELTAGDDPVIHGATLRQNVRRGNIENINRGGGEGNTACIPIPPFLKNTRGAGWSVVGNPRNKWQGR